MMQAVTFDPQRDQFSLSELPIPKPGANDVLVKVNACGLNPVDAKIHLWKSMADAMDENWVPGLDISGVIVDVGSAVGNWRIGDQILCHGNMFRPNGGFAEYSLQDADTLIAHPNIPHHIAAALPCAGWTAWRALHDKLNASQHNSILITGGSGGVGSFAIQIAKHFSIETIIATCSAANRQYVEHLGATHVIDYGNEDVVARVLEITQQQGVAVGLDTIGPDNDILIANSLAFEGQLVELVATVRADKYQDAFMKGLSFHQLSLGSGHRHGAKAKQTLVAAGQAFSTLVEQGVINVPSLTCIGIEQVGTNLTEILKQRTVGKIVMNLC